MIRVVIESPFAGQGATDQERIASTSRNLQYLRAAMHDCFKRGEAPFASHGLYTQPGVLDDNDPDEQKLGIEAGFAWRDSAEKTVVYTDLGISGGMQYGIEDAQKKGRPVEYRHLGRAWDLLACERAAGQTAWPPTPLSADDCAAVREYLEFIINDSDEIDHQLADRGGEVLGQMLVPQ
ncbi:MAG: DUF7768 domain-containing protein [Kofleriaceae bacterium]